MKKTSYLLGVVSGAVLLYNWKFLVKEGVKIGVKVGREVKKVSAKTLEDLEDATAEAMQEVEEQDQAKRETEHQGPVGERKRPATA
jgi:hypothetical protein